MKVKAKLLDAVIYIVLILLAVVILYPLAAIFLSSFKTMGDFMGNPLGIPESFTIENYITAWGKLNFSKFAFNSVLVTGFSIAIVCLFGAMAGYKLSQTFKGSGLIMICFLIGMAIPTQSFIITLFSFFKSIGLLSSYIGMILVYVSMQLPFAILVFSGFFKTIPKALLEAPIVDGCSELKMFFKILLPLSKPVFSTVVILVGMNVWNDFFIPMTINMDHSKYTLPMGLVQFRGETTVNWTPMFAAITIIAVPIILLFLLLQKQFVKGMIGGAVKG